MNVVLEWITKDEIDEMTLITSPFPLVLIVPTRHRADQENCSNSLSVHLMNNLMVDLIALIILPFHNKIPIMVA